MTEKQWKKYLSRIESCPGDCDRCLVKAQCIEDFEAQVETCRFSLNLPREIESKQPSPDNPCIEHHSVLKFAALSMLSVRGCLALGDGRHRKWRCRA